MTSSRLITSRRRTEFTGKERDTDTIVNVLDYFGARYFSSNMGRFTTPDEFSGGPVDLFGAADPPGPLPYADILNPQSLNKYSYAYNNPLRYVDPDGHDIWDFLNGLVNATSTNMVGGLGRRDAVNSDYGKGQAVGDAISVLQGLVETAVGAGTEAGAVALDATGVGAVVGVPANVAGAAIAGHGVMTAGSGFVHLAKSATSGENEYTKAGREAHKNYDPGSGYEKEKKLPSGKRADAVSEREATVRELKPSNPSAVRKGQREVERNRRELEQNDPQKRKWKGAVDTYDR
jgi:RHS repeat-associated protein